jgi:hypothetical protein
MTSNLIPLIWADHLFQRKSKLGMESTLGPVAGSWRFGRQCNWNLWEIENQNQVRDRQGNKMLSSYQVSLAVVVPR